MTVHVGTSGWSYDHGDGVLYPPGTPPRQRLEHYLREFGTVELNASFYRWPAESTFASWRRRLPDGFEMAMEASRGPTPSGSTPARPGSSGSRGRCTSCAASEARSFSSSTPSTSATTPG